MAITAHYSTTISLSLLLVVFLSLRTRKLGLCHGGASTFGGCREDERKALLQFKDDANDASGGLSTWIGHDCCSWAGVACSNSTGHVVRLELSYRGIQGQQISPSLLALRELTYLNLSGNTFNGARIPHFMGSFKKLEYLDLSSATLTGTVPRELGNLSSLRYLDLSDNFGPDSNDGPLLIVDGSSWLSRLSSLRYLNLNLVYIMDASSSLESIGMLPLLSVLHLYRSLSPVPRVLPRRANFTSLTQLHLSGSSFDGTDTVALVPYWPFEIVTLKHLDLSGKQFVGHIPSIISNSTSLEFLDLSRNEFDEEGILAAANGVAKLSHLRTLAWSGSLLRGQLPSWLGDLKKLKTLDLSDNYLSASVPSYPLSALERLDLSRNSLNGTVSLGELSSLVMLDLSSNSLDDVLTEKDFENLTSLMKMDLSGNPTLKFHMRPEWTPPPGLAIAYLSGCQIGPSFPAWLQRMDNISLIDLSNAAISDQLPEWLGNFSSNVRHVDLSNNMIKGKIPTDSLRHLSAGYLDLSNNHLEDPFPQYFSAKLKRLSLANNSLSGQLPPDIGEQMPDLWFLSLAANRLSGNIPSSICKLKELTLLDLSENMLSGEMPNCAGDTHPKLEAIVLSKNKLHGSIPASICSCPSLSFLVLEENYFSGELPSSLAKSSLLILNVGHNNLNGSIPTWIGDNLANLEELNLGSNKFHGEIPSNLGSLSSLDVLDLSRNMLSGPIPQIFAYMARMNTFPWWGPYTEDDDLRKGGIYDDAFKTVAYTFKMDVVIEGRVQEYSYDVSLLASIDLSDNNLYGEIPEGLTTLVHLVNLNLSWNQLTGTIPRNVSRLKSLLWLDLSFNHLTGEIPSSMTSLTFLSIMNFSFNNLSGRIPTGGQFDDHPDPSIYFGNVNLCGSPLPSCGGNATSHPHRMADNGDANHYKEVVWLYLSTALGFIFGFWAFFGTLLLKKKLRISYYRGVDSLYDKIHVFVAINLAKLKPFRGNA